MTRVTPQTRLEGVRKGVQPPLPPQLDQGSPADLCTPSTAILGEGWECHMSLLVLGQVLVVMDGVWSPWEQLMSPVHPLTEAMECLGKCQQGPT